LDEELKDVYVALLSPHYSDEVINDKTTVVDAVMLASNIPSQEYTVSLNEHGILNSFMLEDIEKFSKEKSLIKIRLSATAYIDQECSVELLKHTLKRLNPNDNSKFNKYVQSIKNHRDAYKSGEEQNMLIALQESSNLQCTYTDINKVWLQTLLENKEISTHRNPLFVAVDIGHLLGHNGLLNLFKNKGFSIQRIIQAER